MHEIDMTRALILSMNDWRRRHEPAISVVKAVRLQVGDFTCVEPDQLITTWKAAVKDSWMHGAKLAIETIPLIGRCLVCNNTYTPEEQMAYRSPCCNHPMEEIVTGRELRICSVDYFLSPKVTGQPYDCRP
jgi:hydrogenase nickel incorporation protein HypA/HybF